MPDPHLPKPTRPPVLGPRCNDIDDEVKNLRKRLIYVENSREDLQKLYDLANRRISALVKENQRLHMEITRLQWKEDNNRIHYESDNGGWG